MRKIVLTALACAALFAGCGGSDDEGDGGASADLPPNTVAVQIEDIEFKPPKLDVKVGQTVRWTNDDAVVHNVHADAFKSDNLEQGDSYDWKATKPGTFHYVCTLHPGQEGDVVVSR